jgi:hypothetical protein
MLAHLRGEAAYPLPLPARVTIGWLDRRGWHPGRSPLARALAGMETVRAALAGLDSDLLLRVALAAADPPPARPGRSQAPGGDLD